jgi:hypothetical protein
VYKGVKKRKSLCRPCIQWRKDYRSQPEVIAKKQRYDASVAGKAVQSKANKTPIRRKRQRDKRKNDKAFALRCALQTKVNRMLRGGAKSSVAVEQFCAVSGADELMNHCKQFFHSGMTAENYGILWHVDHTIPCKWYSSSDEDMKRCWSLTNLRPMLGSENKQKGSKVPPDDVLVAVSSHVWPVAWGGALPTEEMRCIMRMDKHH